MHPKTHTTKQLHTTFLLSILMLCFYGQLWAQFPQIGGDIDGEAAGDNSGISVSLSANGNILAIGAYYNDGNGTDAGHVRIYERNGGVWVQKGNDIDGEAINDNSGLSIRLSANGNILAIGADKNDGNGTSSGHVRVYEWNGTTWMQKGNDINGEAAVDQSSRLSLSANGNILAVGAYGNDGNGSEAGHVRIYEWNGTTWLQKGNDIDGEAAGDNSGLVVSLSANGTILAIGAYQNDGNGLNAGHVRIYEWNGAAWVQKGSDLDGEAAGDNSGVSVSLSANGNILAIGAYGNDGNGSNSGHVRIYEWNGTTWVQKGSDINGEAAGDGAGILSLSANGNTIAIGAGLNDGNGVEAGQVRIYEWNGIAWVQKGNDIDGEAIGDYSGQSVSLSADANILAVGAYLNDGNGLNAGHVRVYSLKGVYGHTYQDFNQNGIQDPLETSLANRILILNPGNILLQTNSNGSWFIDSLLIGTYTLTADTSSVLWQLTCPVTQSFTITNPDSSIQAPSFGYISNYPCTAPDISIHAPFLRRGFSNQKVYIQACNTQYGTGILNTAYVIVELDSLLTVQSGSMPYTNLGNNKYQINLGNLFPGQCVDFWLNTTLSTSAVLGQTLCMNAKLYPVEPCALDSIPNPYPANFTPCNTPYDQSHLDINAFCNNDTINFTIINNGTGNMSCFAPVRLYIDGIYTQLDSVQIPSGDTVVFAYTGDGRTWRMEVNQHPLHPGNSNPSTTIERCGNVANWTPNLVNILPHDDADPIIDIYCGLVRGSYDPNDKTGYPLGVGTTHDIQPNQEMDYVIRFQNTGTDTAFTVVIRDTLSMDLDVFSVRSGASSHDYSFRMYGPRVLEWTFSNIMLPDSNSNLIGSNGFVTFKVRQVPNLPVGTVIENSASIYFDFNAPIFTNTSWHTIALPQDLNWDGQETINLTDCDGYTFNNIVYNNSGTYWQVVNNAGLDSLYTLNLTLLDNSSFVLSETLCNSYTAPDAQVYTTSGQYTAVIPNSVGCDSTITINLTIKNSSTATINKTTCYSYTAPDAQVYTSSGQYTAIIPNTAGCDSTITINLTIKDSTSTTINETACNTYTAPDAQTYTTSGQYAAVIPNAAGCDSTITINLTIDNTPTDSITLSGTTLTAYTPNISYQWLDCNNGNAPIVGATNQSFTPLVSGNYAVQMTDGTCTLVSGCVNVTGVLVSNLPNDLGVLIYPNPTTGVLHLEKGGNAEISIEVLDNLGRVLLVLQSSDLITDINLSQLPAGVYYISIGNGERIVKEKIVKL